MRGKVAAMRPRFRRKYGECIDPARVGVEPDRFAIREDQIFGECSEGDDKLAIRLAEAGTRLKFRNTIPKHCRQPAARKALPASETQTAEDRPCFTSDWQNVLTEIGGCAHRPEDVDACNCTRKLSAAGGRSGAFERKDVRQFCGRNELLHSGSSSRDTNCRTPTCE